MAEPLNPAVLGVASVLKSLRTRVGLRENRLHATEVALASLAGLDSVRMLVSQGESPERAIVIAVRRAASTLEPTMSIVADVSLGLGLSAGLVPNADLYAQDLGQRRDALRQNWGQLHELRSAPPGKVPSPRALRLEVESEALTALAVALVGSVGSDNPTRASAGLNQPGAHRDRPQDVVAGTRPPRSRPEDARPRLIPASPPGPQPPTLFRVFQHVAQALRDCLVYGDDGRPSGWPRFLRESPGWATAASTAYGIRAMVLLEGGLAADLIPVAENLRKMAFPDGGFANSGQTVPRPEATAAVLNALCRISATEDFGVHVAQMERDLGDFEKARPFILTMMLETCLLRPAAGLVETLVDSLLAARRSYGDLLLWPEKAEPLLIDPAPSVTHTARAVRALANVQAIRPVGPVQEALDQAVAWLIEQRDLGSSYEFIERPLGGDKVESVYTQHFTAAWVVKALVSAGVPAAHPAVSNAVARIWASYRGDTAALWAWDNGDLPIWMTFDAIEALRLANLAGPGRPAWSLPSGTA